MNSLLSDVSSSTPPISIAARNGSDGGLFRP
jgi:hypothetical protein